MLWHSLRWIGLGLGLVILLALLYTGCLSERTFLFFINGLVLCLRLNHLFSLFWAVSGCSGYNWLGLIIFVFTSQLWLVQIRTCLLCFIRQHFVRDRNDATHRVHNVQEPLPDSFISSLTAFARNCALHVLDIYKVVRHEGFQLLVEIVDVWDFLQTAFHAFHLPINKLKLWFVVID